MPMEDEDLDMSSTTMWSHEAVVMLIETYKEHLQLMNSPRIKKLEVYKKIAAVLRSNGFNYTYEACDRKMRSLKFRYTVIAEDQERSERSQHKWRYFDLMDDLLAEGESTGDAPPASSVLDVQIKEEIQSDSPSETNWTHNAVLLLIQSFKDHMHMLRTPGIKRKMVFQKIEEILKTHGYNYSQHACDKKMRSLKCRYRLISDGSAKKERRRWEYFDLLEDIYGDETRTYHHGNASSPQKGASTFQEPSDGEGGVDDGDDDYEEDPDGKDQSEPTHWSHKAVSIMLDAYKKNLCLLKVQGIKKSALHQKITEALIANGFDYSPVACDRKMRSLRYRYKLIAAESEKKGRIRRKWEYFQIMDDIMAEEEETYRGHEAALRVSDEAPPSPTSSTSTAPPHSRSPSPSSSARPTSPHGRRRSDSPTEGPECKRRRTTKDTAPKPPAWFVGFAENQKKLLDEQKQQLDELTRLQKTAIEIARERNGILKSLAQALLKK